MGVSEVDPFIVMDMLGTYTHDLAALLGRDQGTLCRRGDHKVRYKILLLQPDTNALCTALTPVLQRTMVIIITGHPVRFSMAK